MKTYRIDAGLEPDANGDLHMFCWHNLSVNAWKSDHEESKFLIQCGFDKPVADALVTGWGVSLTLDKRYLLVRC